MLLLPQYIPRNDYAETLWGITPKLKPLRARLANRARRTVRSFSHIGGNFRKKPVSALIDGYDLSSSGFLMACHALFRSRRTHIFPTFDDLIMTTTAVAMKRLLIVQGEERRAFLQLNFR